MARADGRRLWKGFQEISAELARHGVPTPSDAWLAEVERFYVHPTATTWVAHPGRGAGKNLVGKVCDLTECIYGGWDIAKGERHYIVNVSENREEAQKTLRETAGYFGFLNIPCTPTVDTIDLGAELSDRGVKVLACRIGAVSGFRSFGLTDQEAAKWDDEGTNPAEEVIVSALAQTVTHARARKRHFSTPLTRDSFFWSLVERGETDEQIVTSGPSWQFNPTITEEQCRRLATSERVFRREYLGEAQAGAGDAFDADSVEAAMGIRVDGDACKPVLVLDFSSGKKDATTWAIARWMVREQHGPVSLRDYVRVDAIEGIEGRFWSQLDGARVVERIAGAAKAFGVTDVHGDQRESFMLRAEFSKHGLTFHEHPYTAQSKPAAVERVRRWLADRTLSLAKHEKLRTEMLRFEERITSSGQLTFGARGSGHDDYVCLLLTLALVDLAGELPHERTDHFANASASGSCGTFETRPLGYGYGDPLALPDGAIDTSAQLIASFGGNPPRL